MKIISLLLVLIGSVFLFKGFLPARSIWRNVSGEYRSKWLVILILMTFFFFGYLLFDVVLFFNLPLPLELVTSVVFLGGAVFVFIIINLSQSTISAQQKTEEHIKLINESLELRVVERTKELTRLSDFNRVVLDSIADPISIIDTTSFRIVDANLAYIKEVELPKDQIIGRTCYELMHERSLPCTSPGNSCPLVETVSCVDHASVEHVHRTLSGEKRHVEILTSPIRDEQGQIVQVVHIQRDITDRKQAEVKLRESEETYRNLFNNAEVGIFRSRLDGSEVMDVNRKYLEIVGKTLEETIGNPSEILWADPKEREEMVRMLIADGRVSGFEYKKLNTRDGSVRDCLTSMVLYREQGILEGSILDISGRKQAETKLLLREQALARSEQFLNTIIDTEPDCIKLLDIDCNLLMMNRSGLAIIEADSLEQVKGQCVCLLITDQYKDDFIALTQQVFQGIPGILEFEAIGLKGRHVWLETHAVPFRNEREEIIALLGITRDITERKQSEKEKLLLEQQLYQAQKMESLGVLAGGIAHDFNNILAVIICNCSLGIQRPKIAEELFHEIETAAQRAAGLCRQMLAYAGKTQFVESQVDMTSLLDEMLNMLKSTLPQNATIKPYLSGDLPGIEGDASQLRQVAVSLIMNASEAIGEAQGEIRVALTKATIRDEQQEKDYIGKSITVGPYLCLEVTDTGCGMDDETKQRIFEPFYTTKFVGRGLGMSAVLGIITSHGGALQFTSQMGQGTTFKVYLPAQFSDSAGEETSQQRSLAPWSGSGTILLVEDDPQLITVAKGLLETLGFSVIEASNGIEAIEQYRKNSAEIRLVVTDIGMPLMGGYELITELKKLDPAVPIIVSSGFGDSVVTTKIAPEDIAGLISKPYSFDQLREVLKSVVGETLLNYTQYQ